MTLRWRLDCYGTTLVDADFIDYSRLHGQRFIRNGCVVFTISPFVYVRITKVPTLRLVDGPKDGQIASTTQDTPHVVYFQPVVPLAADGSAIAPVPVHELSGLIDTYVHAWDCPCRHAKWGHFEHEYIWSRSEKLGHMEPEEAEA